MGAMGWSGAAGMGVSPDFGQSDAAGGAGSSISATGAILGASTKSHHDFATWLGFTDMATGAVFRAKVNEPANEPSKRARL